MSKKVSNGRKYLNRIILAKSRSIGGIQLAWMNLYAKIRIETGRDVLQESEYKNIPRIEVIQDIGISLAIQLAKSL